MRPEKVVLFLSREDIEKTGIPRETQSLQSDLFEIIVTEENLRPYKKLIPAYERYSGKVIITADDDIIYPDDYVSRLVETRDKNPGCAISLEPRLMLAKNDTAFLDYNRWPIVNGIAGMQVFGRGGAGVLYPPDCFHQDITRRDLFMTLAPTTDDVWFKVMLYLAGTRVASPYRKKQERWKSLKYRQKNALWDYNRLGVNDKNLAAIMRHYGLRTRDFLFAETSAS
jgi:hypothetical protein